MGKEALRERRASIINLNSIADGLYKDLGDEIEIVCIMRIEPKLICKGSLVSSESRIHRNAIKNRLEKEDEMDIYFACLTIGADVTKEFEEYKELENEIHYFAHFRGRKAKINTSLIVNVELNTDVKRLCLKTLNSLYVFKVHEWLGGEYV